MLEGLNKRGLTNNRLYLLFIVNAKLIKVFLFSIFNHIKELPKCEEHFIVLKQCRQSLDCRTVRNSACFFIFILCLQYPVLCPVNSVIKSSRYQHDVPKMGVMTPSIIVSSQWLRSTKNVIFVCPHVTVIMAYCKIRSSFSICPVQKMYVCIELLLYDVSLTKSWV